MHAWTCPGCYNMEAEVSYTRNWSLADDKFKLLFLPSCCPWIKKNIVYINIYFNAKHMLVFAIGNFPSSPCESGLFYDWDSRYILCLAYPFFKAFRPINCGDWFCTQLNMYESLFKQSCIFPLIT